MDRILHDILGNIDEGIALLNHDLNIIYWNVNLEKLTRIRSHDALNHPIYNVLPNFKKNYVCSMLDAVQNDGRKMFLAAAMHLDFIYSNKYVNVKLSRIEKEQIHFVLIEFIDVTHQFLRISELKHTVQKLSVLNRDLKEKERMINRLAYCDGLTGLPNRTLFYRIAERFFERATQSAHPLAFMFIDIDKFKQINDAFGHKEGDDVIIKVAKGLKTIAGLGNIVARFGGDEFLILLPYIQTCDDCTYLASQINEYIRNIKCSREQFDLSVSIGISIYPIHGNSIDKLIVEADRAMYTVKNMGGNGNYCKLQ